MKCDAKFKESVLGICLDALESAGFRRYRKDAVDWPVGKDFNAWVGLNTGLYEDRVEIGPFVGVHAARIEKMWMGLLGRKYPGPYGRAATYSINIGEIDGAADLPTFAFAPWQSKRFIESEAIRLAEIYQSIGLGFSKSISSYESLLPLISQKVTMLGGCPERVACCIYIMGDMRGARQFVEGFLREEPDAFDAFARVFLKMLDDDI
ncbi:hypothetical protein [Sphingomonas kyeonggiensis]|uniref:DUF4304 domain-containing protein n=1 Tax=Sphingomonas kyeonggiensis TaxID=1268553 RepID=A0A7W6JWW8_9SPHN|nr:hypothetical protein [Sphingomonas kyeonggiensis]MBB4101055.1 hypothetical protein [Sphingomonas kyeonggiensis]